MFPPIPVSPGCAGPCSRRIELVPSRRGASLVGGWLAALCLSLVFAVALPLPVRIAFCVGAATLGFAGIRRYFLLAHRKSVRALAWPDDGHWIAYVGPRRLEAGVVLTAGSFHLPGVALFLWLRACDGFHGVFIDTGMQEAYAVRRLIRRLEWAPRGAAESENRQADTIRAQGLKCVTRH